MTLHVINGGESAEPAQQEVPQTPPGGGNSSASEVYQEFVKVITAGGYTNQAVFTACTCLMAHASDSAGWKRQDALPEIIRMYFQVIPVNGEKP